MSSEYLLLKGTEGLVKGEEFNIELGENVVLGRSSKCDICLKYLCEDEVTGQKHFLILRVPLVPEPLVFKMFNLIH